LADRIARVLANSLNGSWFKMVAGVVVLTYALAFVMPSNMGRITLLMPIVMALADRAGLREGSQGRIALGLAVGLGTYELSASILPANVPNLIMTGAAERAYGVQFNYLPHAPVIGVLKGILITICLVRLFPASPARIIADTEPVNERGGVAARGDPARHAGALDHRFLARHPTRMGRVGFSVPLSFATNWIPEQRRVCRGCQRPHLRLSRRHSRPCCGRGMVWPR
jgi:Na+/H+ antiporter NhaD/arsenite permease-like protein